MRHVSLPRLARLSVALALLTALAIPGVASADPPLRFTETLLSVDCPFIVTADGAARPFVFASDQGFSEAGLQYWTAEPTGDEPPVLDGFTGETVITGLSVGATMPLFNAEGDEAGTATINATLVPIGEPEPFAEGGPQFRVEGTTQAATIEGTAVVEAEDILPGPISFDLSSCIGNITIQTIFQVLPSTFQLQRDQFRLSCELTTDDATAFAFASSFVFEGADFGSFVDASITPNDPAVPSSSGGTEASVSAAGVDATWDLFSDETGDPVGQATISAAFDPISVERGHRVSQAILEKFVLTTFAVSGTLSAQIGTATYDFDLSACEATRNELHGIYHGPNGPKAGGALPANDTPDGAIALEPGDSLRMKNGGASIAPEEPCLFEQFGEVFEVPLGRTVWFTIEGTGGPVTVDPSGSDFDTVVGAYIPGGGGLESIGCVDDESGPFSIPQAALTFDTQVGTTYYVQVGGFDFGVFDGTESNPQFGLLKLAVR